jgi:hypothetical protein
LKTEGDFSGAWKVIEPDRSTKRLSGGAAGPAKLRIIALARRRSFSFP